jgi:hypothetical protein
MKWCFTSACSVRLLKRNYTAKATTKVYCKTKIQSRNARRTIEITGRKNTSIMKNRKLKLAGMIMSYCSFLDSPPPLPATALFPVVAVAVVVEVETPCSFSPFFSVFFLFFAIEEAGNQDRMIR